MPRYVPTLSHPYFRHSSFSFSFEDLGCPCDSPSLETWDSQLFEGTSAPLVAAVPGEGDGGEDKEEKVRTDAHDRRE
jgi:hypothetical protein